MNSDTTFTIGFSTCPNDTFIFDALVHNRIDTGGIRFQPVLADVEELNRMALSGKLDIVKISYAHLPRVIGSYLALTSGGALGFGCGPLLVGRTADALKTTPEPLVAIPGIQTTANFLLERYFPGIASKKVMLFSEIEEAVATGAADAGLIIHESRFTYKDKGLVNIADLGELWDRQHSLPIPLGCIAVKKAIPRDIRNVVNSAVSRSVLHAFENPGQTLGFVKKHAFSLSDEVVNQHISLYVNQYSVNLGDLGKQAVRMLLEGQVPGDIPLFVDEAS